MLRGGVLRTHQQNEVHTLWMLRDNPTPTPAHPAPLRLAQRAVSSTESSLATHSIPPLDLLHHHLSDSEAVSHMCLSQKLLNPFLTG